MSNINKINVAVIGMGVMGKIHARNYSESEHANLVTICDSDENLSSFAEKFNCNFYTDYKKMLENENIDAVSIAVPTQMHKDFALSVLNKGKHVLLEKPIADNEKDAKEIINKAKEKNLKLMIGHIERFNPAVIRLKELVDENRLGDIRSIVAKRVGLFPPRIKDANVVVDMAVHDIDIINYLLGEEPSEVHSNTGSALLETREDFAEIFLKYPKTGAFVQVNWITPVKIRKLDITGTKGYAELDYIAQKLTVHESNYNKEFDDFGDYIVKFSEPNKMIVGITKQEPLKMQIESFLDCIKKDTKPKTSGEEGLRALKIALAAIGGK